MGTWAFQGLTSASSARSQQRSKSEMLSRKNFAAGVPAVSMDELTAFADSYGPRSRRADGNKQELRGGSRFERSEARAHGGLYQDGSLEEYYGPRSRSREPLTDADRGWSYSPPRRRPPDDAHLPRLVSRTPGTAPKYDHSFRGSGLERQVRPEGASRGGSLETPSKLSSQLGPRSASYYAWSPPATYEAGAPPGDEEEEDTPDDTLPPYSELELSRGPSYRGRDLPYHSNSEKKRKKETPAKKTVRPRRPPQGPVGTIANRGPRGWGGRGTEQEGPALDAQTPGGARVERAGPSAWGIRMLGWFVPHLLLPRQDQVK